MEIVRIDIHNMGRRSGKERIVAKKRIYYSWELFDKDARKLARLITRAGKPKNIYGVPRGGLILAVYLSHLLDRPLVYEVSQIGRDTLIADDTCDTGATLNRLANFTDRPIATLFNNEVRKIEIPRHLYARLTNGKWIVFPWETRKSSKRDNE